MSDFEPQAPGAPAALGKMAWTLRMTRQEDDAYEYSATGTAYFTDGDGNYLPHADLHGNLMNLLTTQEKQGLKTVMDRIAAVARGKYDLEG